jgi:hypothetical protein
LGRDVARDWGLPNWADAGAYGETSRWNEDQWRWEFTRRREDYRKDYSAWPSVLYPSGTLVAHVEDAEAARELLVKYGLERLPDPSVSEHSPNLRWFQLPYDVFALGEGPPKRLGGNGINVDAPEGTAAVVFDLSRPLSTQLEFVRELFSWWETNGGVRLAQRRKHPRKWLRYLRVLDGREFGASWSEIATIVLSADHVAATPQAARQEHQQAQVLMFNWPV